MASPDLPSGPVRPARDLRDPFKESVRVLGAYIRAKFVIAVVITILYAIGFALTRVPWWPLIAILGGLASLIPRFGVLIPLALVALADLLGGVDILYWTFAFGVWFAVLIFDEFFLTPRLLSKPLGLKPLPVFLVLLIGSIFFGPIGFLLAVPVLAVVAVFWRYFFDTRNDATSTRSTRI